MKSFSRLALLALLFFSFAPISMVVAAEAEKQPENMLKTIKDHKELSKFANMIDDADLEDMFEQKDSPLTVFAPTNDALGKLPSDVVKRIKDKAQLQSFVKYHIISDNKVYSSNIKGRKVSPSSASGETLLFNGMGEATKVNDAKFVTADVNATNGLLHIMDAPIIPASMIEIDEKARTKPEMEVHKEIEIKKENKNEAKTEDKPAITPTAKSDKKPDEGIKKEDEKKPASTTSNGTVAPTQTPTPPPAPAEPKKSSRGWKIFGW